MSGLSQADQSALDDYKRAVALLPPELVHSRRLLGKEVAQLLEKAKVGNRPRPSRKRRKVRLAGHGRDGEFLVSEDRL